MKICVTTADNMSDETFEFLKNGLINKYPDAEIVRIVDNSVIGGFSVKTPDAFFDYTVQTALSEMEKHILSK